MGAGSRQGHRTRHNEAALVGDGRTTRRPARGALSSVTSERPSAPPAEIAPRRPSHSPLSRHHAARPNSHVDVAAISSGELVDARGERLFVGTPAQRPPLHRLVLAEHTTGKPFQNSKFLSDLVDARTLASGAQKISDAAALCISRASVRTHSALHSRSSSFASSF